MDDDAAPNARAGVDGYLGIDLAIFTDQDTLSDHATSTDPGALTHFCAVAYKRPGINCGRPRHLCRGQYESARVNSSVSALAGSIGLGLKKFGRAGECQTRVYRYQQGLRSRGGHGEAACDDRCRIRVEGQ